ncbi:STM2901 family protein [Citrobacter tructae]|uniref:STM2901 family protein n=1 Tax=Citrobacter tructae TaxID=2562449 RepID=UPI003F54C2C5
MDTTEEKNGTYFYHGHVNVTPGELFDLIFIEQLADALGMTTEAVSMVLIGQPFIPVSGKLSAATNTPGTSVASIISRKLLGDARFPFGLRPSAPMGKLSKLKMVPTNKIATFLGRWVPFIGYAELIITVQLVAKRTRDKYNLIARPKDRIQWTSF